MTALRTPLMLLVLALTLGGCVMRGPGLYLDRDERHHGGRGHDRHDDRGDHDDDRRSDRR